MSNIRPAARTLSRRAMLQRGAVLSAGLLTPWLAACGSNANNKNNGAASPVGTVAAPPSASAAAATASSAPSVAATVAAASPTPAFKSTRQVSWTYQTGWYAQVESAAVLAAVVYNTLPPNIKIDARDGGPGSTPTTLVASGQLDMCAMNCDSLLFARDQGLPLKVIMSPFSQAPQVLVAHKELSITGFADMKGHKVAVSNGSTFWDYLKKKYGYSDGDLETYSGSIASWLQDKTLITQAFATNEPYQMQQQGVAYDEFFIKDAGYDAPNNMIGATDKFIQQNADVLPDFVLAVQLGMQKAIADPTPLFKEIQKRSPNTTDGNIQFSWGESKKLLNRPYTLEHGFGAIDPDQMTGLFGVIKDLGLFKTTFKPEDVYTNQFVSPLVVKTS